MRAYHNDPQIKEDLLTQVQGHHDADEIIKGVYWEDGKGCAVGCILHSDKHKEFETRFGIPEILAYLIDSLFELLPNKRAKEWPMLAMRSIPVGADLSDVWRQFAIRMLQEHCLPHTKEGSAQYKAIVQVAYLYQINCKDKETWRNAAYDARAAYVTRAADADADDGAAWAADAAAAWAATADADDGAAWAADAAAWAIAAAAYAAAADGEQAVLSMADKLIELLQQAPVENP